MGAFSAVSTTQQTDVVIKHSAHLTLTSSCLKNYIFALNTVAKSNNHRQAYHDDLLP